MCDSRLLQVAVAVLLAATSGAAQAEDVQFHGFISQGFVLSEGNHVNGSSADSSGSARYQEFGVNASWRPRSDLLLSGQLASVRAGLATDEYLTLEYALADWTLAQGEGGRAGLRGGKIKLPIGFYNDSRDAVFTRPGILLPESIYLENSGARAFGYFSSIGGAIYADWYAGNHAFYLEGAGYGQQDLGESADVPILRRDAAGTFEVEDGALLRLSDDYDGGRFRAAVSLLSTTLQYNATGALFHPATNPFDQDGELDFEQTVLSLQYNGPSLSLTAEYVWRDFKLDDLLSPPIPQADSTAHLKPRGGYLQSTYRLSQKWSSFLRYDQQIRDGQDRDGREQAARLRQPRHYFFAHDWAAGTRYDLRSDLALLAEFHYVDGAGWVNPLDNPDFGSGTAERYWNLFALMLAYRF